MAKGNGKTEVNLDLDRELPAAEDEETGPISITGKAADESAVSETEKLRAERDALLDRLARLQAEFDNARKRAVREQQDFREFAAADVIKNFLPILGFTKLLKWWIRAKCRITTSSTNCSAATDIRSGCCVLRWCGSLAMRADKDGVLRG